ncbi:MAG: shikimate dehydrogenase family protein, partial [Acidimicrobiales bacterium]
LGAGGAARAVVAGVAAAGAGEVVVVNRTADRAAAAADLAGPVGRAGSTDDLATADVVVNATPLGMGASSQMPCPPRLLRRGQVVVDLVYDPLQTPWLAALRAAGVDSHNGLSMLVHQAALAFELWTGVEAPLGAMREAVPGEPRA